MQLQIDQGLPNLHQVGKRQIQRHRLVMQSKQQIQDLVKYRKGLRSQDLLMMT